MADDLIMEIKKAEASADEIIKKAEEEAALTVRRAEEEGKRIFKEKIAQVELEAASYLKAIEERGNSANEKVLEDGKEFAKKILNTDDGLIRRAVDLVKERILG